MGPSKSGRTQEAELAGASSGLESTLLLTALDSFCMQGPGQRCQGDSRFHQREVARTLGFNGDLRMEGLVCCLGHICNLLLQNVDDVDDRYD